MVLALLALLLQEPLPPQDTVRRLQVPDGFEVRLFAAEPDVVQPVSFAQDDRGRLWVAEMRSYPKWDARDRILIFEDRDGDGRADKRLVFFEGLTYVTGIEVGFGGLWVIAPPRMLFIPDRNGDDLPDGPPEVLLDGFGLQGGHNIANGFTWGPDGWLYAGHGRTSISEIGRPGAPLSERVHFDGGVWRYHPTRRVFEAWADGTTNPWGVAFDDFGQLFISNCVDPHLFHAVQGAHFEPWRGRESSRFAYRRIDTVADHLHWASGTRVPDAGRRDQVLAAGGGHAHCGTMVYLGDSFPDAYRGQVFMSNLHGHRINNDLLARRGSGYSAAHGPDFLVSSDPMFLGLGLQFAPDGSVFISDWYDRGECHTRKPHDGSGRIYKIVYRDTKPVPVDLAKLSDADLVKLQLHRNDWQVVHARRLLQERGPNPAVHGALKAILRDSPDVTRKLRALWALHATGGLAASDLAALLDHRDEHVRAWAIQLDLEDRDAGSPQKLLRMAELDPSPVVRLYLASACRRMSRDARWPILRRLAARPDDVSDPNLPLMLWYALEPVVGADPARGLELIRSTAIPLLREFASRRLASLTPVRNQARGLEGRIAFHSRAPQGWDLQLLDRETGTTTKIAEDAAPDYNAVLSPDGRQVAFVSHRDGNAEIYVVGTDGRGLRRLTDDPALDDRPSWSPDGRSLVFSSTRDPSPTPGRSWNALYVMAADGSGVQRVSPADAADLSPAWSPWGDAVAFVSDGDLWVMRPDGGERRLVVKDAGWPTFAPRSRSTLYFHARRDGAWGVWRINADGTGLRRITPADVEAFTPAVAGSTPLLVAAVRRGDHRQIELMDLDSFKLSPLTADAADHWNPSISADGRYVAYHRGAPAAAPSAAPHTAHSPDGKRTVVCSDRNLVLTDPDGGNARRLTEGRWTDTDPDWSRSGIVFASDRSGVFEIWRVDPDGGGLRRVVEGGGWNGSPRFSPDGQWVLFASRRAGRSADEASLPASARSDVELFAVRPDGTGLLRLTHDGFEEGPAAWR